jgi:tRNA(Ile)-lysidine synthase
VKTLAQAVLAYVRKHEPLKAGDRVGVAVSGGADSVALLRLLLDLRRELGIVLSVVHFNHRLRGAESDGDQQFVAELAQRHKLELRCDSGDVADHAATQRLSLEAAAREMRYAYFRRLLAESGLDRIATAHTLDDQAETVLLRVARGAGTRGLAGIYPKLSAAGSQFSEASRQSLGVSRQGAASIIRPFLGIRRGDIEAYLKALGQEWREDSSNRDLRHARNRVRHGILPRLERNLNPAIREALAETAEIARAEEEYWEEEVAKVLPLVRAAAGSDVTLKLTELSALPLALRRRLVRAAAEDVGLRLEFRQVEEILALATGTGKSLGLPNDWRISRSKRELRFEQAGDSPKAISDYEYPLCVPGRIRVAETGTWIEALRIQGDGAPGYNRDHLLDAALVSNELTVRNWRAGDRFWPAHTKSPKKIKELLQERHLAGVEKKLWPVVVCGDEVVWVRGLAAAARLRLHDGAAQNEALLIREAEE